MTSNGHHESEAAEYVDPARRPKTAEIAVSGATPEALEAFTAMQDEARSTDVEDDAASTSQLRRLTSWFRNLIP